VKLVKQGGSPDWLSTANCAFKELSCEGLTRSLSKAQSRGSG